MDEPEPERSCQAHSPDFDCHPQEHQYVFSIVSLIFTASFVQVLRTSGQEWVQHLRDQEGNRATSSLHQVKKGGEDGRGTRAGGGEEVLGNMR
jgi:hypothetical protein